MTRYLTLLFLLAPALLACDQLNRQSPPVVPPPAVEPPPAGFGMLFGKESPLYNPRYDCLEGNGDNILFHQTGVEPGYYAYSIGEMENRSSNVLLINYEHTGEGWISIDCASLKPNTSAYYYFKRTPDPAEDWFVVKRNIEGTPQPDGTYRIDFGPATFYRVPTSEAPLYFTDRLDEKGKPRLNRKRTGPLALVHGPYCLQEGARWFLAVPDNVSNPHTARRLPSPPNPPAGHVLAKSTGFGLLGFVDGRYIHSAGGFSGGNVVFGLFPREQPYEIVYLQTTDDTGSGYGGPQSYITWGLVQVRQGEDGRLVCNTVDWQWVEMPYVPRKDLPNGLYLKSEEYRRYDPFSWENGIPPWQR
ncbi:hypothetical protein [Meiothermus sp. CFH 77666]|uniref:hypothetical protein n=1 Tax=Meiothermus sp. CFH 77666 TaxID=2817942 RepID=UPI001AA05822|nr:hypothetical protein [Meiothermus sp. CFH 77666]MBO1438447.1 hypothetical protein [Meiothermus sp. CFH 77666]